MLIGYARVSTKEQNLDLQLNALTALQCDRIFEDKRSSVKERPELQRALDTLRAGDTLIIWKLDRLGRSMRELVLFCEDLNKRGIEFRSITELIDTTTPMGKFFFHMIAAMAQMERERLIERVQAGLDAARLKGRVGGRKPGLPLDKIKAAQRALQDGMKPHDVARMLGVSRPTLYRWLPACVSNNQPT